jgi:hypothetical protein
MKVWLRRLWRAVGEISRRHPSEIEPGGWGNPERMPASEVARTTSVADLESNDEIVATCTAFRDEIHSAISVLYPCCGYDVGPARVFSRVTFLVSFRQACVTLAG